MIFLSCLNEISFTPTRIVWTEEICILASAKISLPRRFRLYLCVQIFPASSLYLRMAIGPCSAARPKPCPPALGPAALHGCHPIRRPAAPGRPPRPTPPPPHSCNRLGERADARVLELVLHRGGNPCMDEQGLGVPSADRGGFRPLAQRGRA